MEQLGQNEVDADHKQVHIISMESFYKPLSEEQRRLAMRGKQNFDHPGQFHLQQTLVKPSKRCKDPWAAYSDRRPGAFHVPYSNIELQVLSTTT